MLCRSVLRLAGIEVQVQVAPRWEQRLHIHDVVRGSIAVGTEECGRGLCNLALNITPPYHTHT